MDLVGCDDMVAVVLCPNREHLSFLRLNFVPDARHQLKRMVSSSV